MGWAEDKIGYFGVPWGHRFDQDLMRLGDITYRYQGDELLHEIHKSVMEANHINIRFYKATRWRLNLLLAMHAATLIYLVVRFG